CISMPLRSCALSLHKRSSRVAAKPWDIVFSKLALTILLPFIKFWQAKIASMTLSLLAPASTKLDINMSPAIPATCESIIAILASAIVRELVLACIICAYLGGPFDGYAEGIVLGALPITSATSSRD